MATVQGDLWILDRLVDEEIIREPRAETALRVMVPQGAHLQDDLVEARLNDRESS